MKIKSADYIWNKIKNGTFIIAEAGKNFIQTKEEKTVEEYLDNAIKLVDEASRIGADAIKFQTHNVEDEHLNIDVTSPHFKESNRYNWVSRNTRATPLDRFWMPLKRYCDRKDIIFFSTPMSRGAALILDKVGIDVWKIGSGDILDFVLLDHLRRSGKPIIISSGMSTIEEVERALSFIREKNKKVALLHCVSKYPCPVEDLNLRTIDLYRERFQIPIGFSDHSIEVDSSLAAIAMGAKIIEKHFSLSRDFWGSDHKVSLVPEEFTNLIKGSVEMRKNPKRQKEILRGTKVKQMMGIKHKILQDDESVFRPIFRKSLVAGIDIQAGSTIRRGMVYAMRPQIVSVGLPSDRYLEVLGRRTRVDLKRYDPITIDILV